MTMVDLAFNLPVEVESGRIVLIGPLNEQSARQGAVIVIWISEDDEEYTVELNVGETFHIQKEIWRLDSVLGEEYSTFQAAVSRVS